MFVNDVLMAKSSCSRAPLHSQINKTTTEINIQRKKTRRKEKQTADWLRGSNTTRTFKMECIAKIFVFCLTKNKQRRLYTKF